MLKLLVTKKEYLIIVVIAILFLFISGLAITSINQLQGNARVINYAGIVRGATQKLIKKELMGQPDDLLIKRLDGIVNELMIGQGINKLTVLPNTAYLNSLRHVQQKWQELKQGIATVRVSGTAENKSNLYELSESYFMLVDDTVSLAEIYSEQQVNKSKMQLIYINIVFVILVLFGVVCVIRALTLKRRADSLNKIAYLDPLTQMANRASCERQIDEYNKNPPAGDIAVFMFDMNNLKRVNDQLGHQGGDRVIAEFARIILNEGEKYGFISRYGGDEFVAFIPNANQRMADQYLTQINDKVIAYNILHINELEKLSFAAGCYIDNIKNMPLEEMLNKADQLMYKRKRQMKENRQFYLDKI